MSRDKGRMRDDWDDEARQDPLHVPTRRPRHSSSLPPQPGQRPYKKRSIWPWLLMGCTGGVVILVAAAAITVFVAFRSVTGGGGGGGGIFPVIANSTTYTQQGQPQALPISTLNQMQVHNQIGDVTITVASSATTPTLTTVKKVKATSSDEANKEFGNISVQVQPATSASSLSISANVPDTGGLFGSHNDAVDLAITLPPQSVTSTPTIPAATPFTLNADTSIGNMMINGLSGVLQIKDGIGNISVIHAALSDGSHLETGTGNVSFDGSLDPTPLANNAAPRYKLQSETGRIDVTLPAGTNTILDANTNAGTINSDFPINITPSANSANFYGPLTSASTPGSSQPVLTLDVSTGDVNLHKA